MRASALKAAARQTPVTSPSPRGSWRPEDPSEGCELRVFRNQPGGERSLVAEQPGKMTEFRPNYYGSWSPPDPRAGASGRADGRER